jgi:hypothetical protein
MLAKAKTIPAMPARTPTTRLAVSNQASAPTAAPVINEPSLRPTAEPSSLAAKGTAMKNKTVKSSH